MAVRERPLVNQVVGDRVIVARSIGTINTIVKAPRGPRRRPRRRREPARQLPRPFPNLLDRTAELEQLAATLDAASPAQVYADSGVGKSVLLRRLAHQTAAADLPDGVVCLPAHRVPLADLLLAFHDAFYEWASPDRPPTPADMALGLQPIRALVLVDDVDLEADDVQRLLDAAPGSVFVLASTRRLLFGEGRALGLRGLPEADALRLFASELGRALVVGEHTAAARVCAALRGHPLGILQAAARVRDEGVSLFDLAGEIDGRSGPTELTARRVLGLSEAERRVLGLLAAIGDTDLGVEHIERLVGPGARDALAGLERRHLIQSHSPRYSLRATLDPELERDLAPGEWRAQLAQHLIESSPTGSMAQELDAALRLQSWASETDHWREAVDLAQAMDGALVTGGRLGAWERSLDRALDAAQRMGDRAAEAWALHQTGTRLLYLGQDDAARASLNRALRIRDAIGDVDGARATRENLRVLAPKGAPWWAVAGGALGVIIGGLVALQAGGQAVLPPPLGPTPTYTPTAEPPLLPLVDPTGTPTPVSSGPPTRTPTSTAVATRTPTVAPPTLTPTVTPIPTRTPTLTPTPTRTPTAPPALLKVAGVTFLNTRSDQPGVPAPTVRPATAFQVWIEVDAIEVRFANIDVDVASALKAITVRTAANTVVPGQVAATAQPRTVRWRPQQRLPDAVYRLVVNGDGDAAVVSIQRQPLDGEYVRLPSGNNVPGGNFVLDFQRLTPPD